MIEITNKNITLRTMTQKEHRALWRKFEPENKKLKFTYNEETVDRIFEKCVARESWNPTVGIFTKNDEVIGELTFGNIVYSEFRCDLSLFIAVESYRGKGLGTEAVMLAKRCAKDKMGLKKMYCDVSSKDKKMQAVLKKCGFQNTKTFKGEASDGGDRMVFFAIL